MNRYSRKSNIRTIKVKRGRHKLCFRAEVLNEPIESLNAKALKVAVTEIRDLVTRNWGDFGETFIKNHVLKSDFIVVLRNSDQKLIGLASISKKQILNREIYYFELTVVDKAYESLKLSFKLNLLLMQKIIFKDILRGKLNWEFMLITPNMKVLGSLSNIADFIYPDPYELNRKTMKIPLADDESFAMAKDLISKSDHPERKIHREGNVLEDSYKDTPSLIYEPNNVPKYFDEIVNEFGEQYLEYSKKTGKELIVRAKFGLRDFLRALLTSIWSS